MNIDIDIKDLVIKTERLILRAWNEDDLEDFYEYARVDGVGQMAGWAPHETIEETSIILKSFIEGKKVLAIEKDGKVIGSLGIENYKDTEYLEFDKLKGTELGFVLSKDYWGQGLMLEAVEAVLNYLFSDKEADFVMCGYFARNGQSKRVQEKAHFRYYADTITNTRIGTEEQTKINIITKEEWNKLQEERV